VIFIAGMSGLMLFLFNPFYLINHELYLNEHTQYLFFAFAIILVFIAYQMVLDNFKPFPTGIIMTSIRRILTPTPTSKKDL
jgi:predicted tellurium resistance membrane protein TerC